MFSILNDLLGITKLFAIWVQPLLIIATSAIVRHLRRKEERKSCNIFLKYEVYVCCIRSENFMSLLDTRFPSVKFMFEIENKLLPCLDILVIRIYTNRLEFDLFRKDTHTDRNILYIMADNTRWRVYNFFFHWFLSFPLNSETFAKNKSTTKEKAESNAYPNKFVLWEWNSLG